MAAAKEAIKPEDSDLDEISMTDPSPPVPQNKVVSLNMVNEKLKVRNKTEDVVETPAKPRVNQWVTVED